MSIYKPYTYLIGWTNHNKWYYGVRYAKACDPSDLWTTYFTSSKYVKAFRKKYGEPNVIQVRRVFEDKKKSMLWENKVLKRLKVVDDDKWLNETYNIAIDYKVSKRNTIPGSLAAASKRRGKTMEEFFGVEKAKKLRKELSIRSKNNWNNPTIADRMKKKPADTSKYREAALKRWTDPEKKAQLCESMKRSK